jgi:hypothetical protein
MRADDILELVTGPAVPDAGCAGRQVKPDEQRWPHRKLWERFRVTRIDISESNSGLMRSLGIDDVHVQSADS